MKIFILLIVIAYLVVKNIELKRELRNDENTFNMIAEIITKEDLQELHNNKIMI